MSSLDPALDLFPLAASILAAITCAILGNFLLLRRESLMGDAISHGVLPGLVIGFLITGDRSPVVMMIGATAAGVVTILLVTLVRRVGRIEPGAAMGVVFSVLFALGVLLIEQAAARQVDLDADCVLYGQLETLAWFDAPTSWGETVSWSTLRATPRPVWTLATACLLAMVFTTVLFKELRISMFDPGLAAALGFRPRLLGLVTNIMVAVATVASFEAVGSILVIAMLICPAATARLLTDRLANQIVWSVGVALFSTIVGYRAATIVPGWFDGDSVNAAGAMTVCSGAMLVLVMLAAPRHGALARLVRRRRLGRRIAIDDLITALWRTEEDATEAATPEGRTHVRPEGFMTPRIVGAARRLGLVTGRLPDPRLTEQGRARATELMIRHRLWESYLVSEAGLAPDHVHDAAERLEHVRLAPPRHGDQDPQGRPIPPTP